jgi:hypothetical protein
VLPPTASTICADVGSAEIVPQCPHDPGVIVDHEQDRM